MSDPKDPGRYEEFVKLLVAGGFTDQQAETLAKALYGGFDADIEFNKVSTVECVIRFTGIPPSGPPTP